MLQKRKFYKTMDETFADPLDDLLHMPSKKKVSFDDTTFLGSFEDEYTGDALFLGTI